MCEKDRKFLFGNKLLSGFLSLVFTGTAVRWLQEFHHFSPQNGLNMEILSRAMTLTLLRLLPLAGDFQIRKTKVLSQQEGCD